MRTRINISHATPEEIKNLTMALQNVTTVLDAVDDDGDRHPRIWVHDDGGMGWGSPSISRQRAADVLREFDRLESGLFDKGVARGGLDPAVQVAQVQGDDTATVSPHIRVFSDGAKVRHVKSDHPFVVINGEPDSHGRIMVQESRLGGPINTHPQDWFYLSERTENNSERANEVEAKGFRLGAHVWHKGDEYEVQAIWGDEDETVNISKVGGDPSRQRRVPINVLELVEREDQPDTGTFEEMDERDGKVVEPKVDLPAGDSEQIKYTVILDDEDTTDRPWGVYLTTETNGERVGDPVHIAGFATQEEADERAAHLNSTTEELFGSKA